jgi:signal transduction histidine kinase
MSDETPVAPALNERAGLAELRRLRIVGVGAPIVFLTLFEVFRLTIIGAALPSTEGSVVAAGITIAAAVVFGLVIFFMIERTQAHILRQNRDLTAVNGVSLAIQGELDVGAVLDVGVRRLVEATGADSVTISPLRLDAESAVAHQIVSPTAQSRDLLSAPTAQVDVPLAGQAGPIGRLRLVVPQQAVASLPSVEALHMIGHQLGAALQIGDLVSDLQRRKAEDEMINQALLEISNQAPLAQVLALIVRGARERLAADNGGLWLSESALGALAAQGETGPVERGAEAWLDRQPAAGEWMATVDVPVWTPGEQLGELWVARRAGPAFGERDRRTLTTFGGIAAIAITAARLRDNERQGAILAERDRIARELHDSMAQVLGSTHLRLRALLSKNDLRENGMAEIARELNELAEVTHEAYGDVREAILGLREASRPRGLLESLREYVAKIARQSHLDIALETAIDDEPLLSASSEIQLIRVIQEALTNVRKHAQATSAQVKVASAADGGLMIVVEDNGRGFDPPVKLRGEGGFGLQTMRERMELCGGSLRIESQPGRGTRVVAVLPAIRDSRAPAADHR